MFNFGNWFLCQFSSNTCFFGGGFLNAPKSGKRKKESIKGDVKLNKTWRWSKIMSPLTKIRIPCQKERHKTIVSSPKSRGECILSIVFLPLVKFCQYCPSTPSNGSVKHHWSLVGRLWLMSDKIIILFRMSTPSLLGAFQIQFCGFFPQSEGDGTPHSAIVLTKNKGNFWPKNTIVST